MSVQLSSAGAALAAAAHLPFDAPACEQVRPWSARGGSRLLSGSRGSEGGGRGSGRAALDRLSSPRPSERKRPQASAMTGVPLGVHAPGAHGHLCPGSEDPKGHDELQGIVVDGDDRAANDNVDEEGGDEGDLGVDFEGSFGLDQAQACLPRRLDFSSRPGSAASLRADKQPLLLSPLACNVHLTNLSCELQGSGGPSPLSQASLTPSPAAVATGGAMSPPPSTPPSMREGRWPCGATLTSG